MDDKGKHMGLSLHFQMNPNARKNSILLRSFFSHLWDQILDLLVVLFFVVSYLAIYIALWW